MERRVLGPASMAPAHAPRARVLVALTAGDVGEPYAPREVLAPDAPRDYDG
jgi:hypothetical protein